MSISNLVSQSLTDLQNIESVSLLRQDLLDMLADSIQVTVQEVTFPSTYENGDHLIEIPNVVMVAGTDYDIKIQSNVSRVYNMGPATQQLVILHE
jgi:hypothetical protein